jgi:hypothetical protein
MYDFHPPRSTFSSIRKRSQSDVTLVPLTGAPPKPIKTRSKTLLQRDKDARKIQDTCTLLLEVVNGGANALADARMEDVAGSFADTA